MADDNGRNIRQIGQVKAGDKLSIYVSDGTIMATADSVEKKNYGKKE